MSALFPLQPGGSAETAAPHLGQTGDLELRDLTPLPRFGLKGPGAADWFESQGMTLPPVNRRKDQGGVDLLRLGARDILALADPDAPAALEALRAAWEAKPEGYSSWREECWAWLRLTGPAAPGVAARLCALDLRAAAFGADQIAQTRFAHQDVVLLRTGGGFDLLFDIAATAQVVHDIHAAATREHRAP